MIEGKAMSPPFELRFRLALPCGAVMRATMDWGELLSMERLGHDPVSFMRYRMRKYHVGTPCRSLRCLERATRP